MVPLRQSTPKSRMSGVAGRFSQLTSSLADGQSSPLGDLTNHTLNHTDRGDTKTLTSTLCRSKTALTRDVVTKGPHFSRVLERQPCHPESSIRDNRRQNWHNSHSLWLHSSHPPREGQTTALTGVKVILKFDFRGRWDLMCLC